MTFHLHTYKPLLKDVEAYWQKGIREGFQMQGMVKSCRCTKMLFVPRDRRLRSVEVTLERRQK